MKPNLSRWRFFRAGGFDQVRLETAAELLAIGELDQKLWVALACPTKGVEFDARTLSFVDSDTDGFVRAPELISAVQWAGERLTQPEVLVKMLPGVPLSAIKTDDEAGAAIAAAAREALAHSGGTDDMVTVEAASAAHQRFADLALAAWEAAGAEVKPLGDATDAAYVAMTAVQAKVDDWFVRCSLAAFDARAGDAMNASGDALTALGGVSLKGDTDGIAALPLAHVRAQAELPLATGLNPAWAAPMAAFYAAVVTPLLGELSHLTSPQWQSLKDKLTPYGTWLGTKPDPLAQGEGVRDLEKLACFTRDLLTLANNFVAFKDFYSRQGPATFQIGTLYIDERACDLCVAVNDAGKHASMAGLSRVCLIYVDCVRGAEKMSVAAAMTAGDVSYLMVGRNGVFYDRKGQDWNATITKLVDNPISLRQAFWSPYKRMARLVSEQLQKMAASKAKASEDQLGNMAQATTQKAGAASKPAAKAKPVEIALAPVDNVLLANLCGPLDENIRQIETGFDVVIKRRNERFSIFGEKSRLTAEALQHFYGMSREALTVDEIQLGLIEMRNAPVRRISRKAEGPVDGPQLITRKTELHGRTPRQVAYLKAIQEHDITFGIGPAGTGKTETKLRPRVVHLPV